jgi:hypothetical protein
MGLFEKQSLRRVEEDMRRTCPISYKLNNRQRELTDPFEYKVTELFHIHVMFTQGWMCYPEFGDMWKHYRGKGSKHNDKLYTEKQRLRLITKHFNKTMLTIKNMEAERGK